MARIQLGGIVVQGYINHVKDNRLLMGTGSYTTKDGQKVYKESITIFLDAQYDGEAVQKGDYVRIFGDLAVATNKDDPNVLQATMNVRSAKQLTKPEAPQRRTEDQPATNTGIPASADEDDDI